MNAQLSPKVSVIIPAYNSERYVGDSLQSVLDQTFHDYEVIVVDDGSTDETKARVLAARGPVRYIHQSNQGPAAARNTGIGAARGELICFLDADDSWTHDKLQMQVEFMDRNPGVGLVFADEEEFDDVGVQCVSLLSKSPYHAELDCRHRHRRAVPETPAAELHTHEHGDGENGVLQDDRPLRCDTERTRGPRYVVPDCGPFPDRLHPESPGPRNVWSRQACRETSKPRFGRASASGRRLEPSFRSWHPSALSTRCSPRHTCSWGSWSCARTRQGKRVGLVGQR